MADSSPEFGPFGSKRPIRRGLFSNTALKIAGLFSLAVLLPAAIIGWGDFYENFVEGEPPVIEVKNPPLGLGLEGTEITITLRDRQSGLDDVVIRAEQAGRSTNVFKKSYPKKQLVDDVTIALDAKKLQLQEGDARISILAFDASFWSNRALITVPLRVDYKRPQIEVFSAQHNAVQGGAELVFYRLKDLPDTFSGMKVGSELLPGFPARGLDADFKDFADIYCAFFPVPLGFDDSVEKIRVFARDAVGNMSTAPLNYRAQKVGSKRTELPLVRAVLDVKLEELYREFRDKEARLTGRSPDRIPPIESEDDRMSRFRAVNEAYRDLIDKATKPIFSRPKPERFWTEKFFHFSGKHLRSFGETTVFALDGKAMGEYTHRGVLFAAPAGASVLSANRGIVIFSDTLGPYGKTVIVDHGFGLTSLYSHMSAVTKLEGDRVERGDMIGQVGSTGLVFSPSLGFEIRLHGIPVRPAEWWDAAWIRDHVDLKVNEVKKALGIRIVTQLR